MLGSIKKSPEANPWKIGLSGNVVKANTSEYFCCQIQDHHLITKKFPEQTSNIEKMM